MEEKFDLFRIPIETFKVDGAEKSCVYIFEKLTR